MLAYVYALMDLNEEAIDQYRRTIHQSPSYVKAYYNLGNCYLKSGEITLALQAYQTILELDPAHARAHFAIGQALARSSQLPLALDAFQEALSLRGEFPECHLAYARALEAVGRVREALHHYRAYVQDPGALDQRGDVEAHIHALGQMGWREVTSEHRPVRQTTAELQALGLIDADWRR